MSGTFALASAIAEMDRAALDALVRTRRPAAPSTIVDPIGLATALLRADSIAQAIALLDAVSLGALLRLADGESDARTDTAALRVAAAHGLIGRASGALAALPEVTDAVRAALTQAGIETERFPAEFPPPPTSDADTSAWYVSALSATAQAAECLRVLDAQPGRINRNGAIAVSTVRALADTTGVATDAIALTLEGLQRTGLVDYGRDRTALHPGPAASAWLARDPVSRWLALAGDLAACIPSELTALLSTDAPGAPAADLSRARAVFAERFPLLPDHRFDDAQHFLDAAEHLGLTVEHVLSHAGAALLRGDRAAAELAATEQFPRLSPGVYVQPDLSVVVPGPLDPSDEALLSVFSQPEHVAVASTRRITEASLAAAFERGYSTEAIRAHIARLSLTGVPQPLEFAISSLSERLGSIMVHEHDGFEGRTRIVVARSELAATLLVDRALHHLQLSPGPSTGATALAGGSAPTSAATVLFSRLRFDHVLSALADARYHATRGDSANGRSPRGATAAAAPIGIPNRTDDEPCAGPSAPAGTTPADPATTADSTGTGTGTAEDRAASRTAQADGSDALAELVERVHTAARTAPGESDFVRRLELAMRDRTPVRVTAEARGQTREFVLVPVSVTAGRLRALDQGAGVERTLPVSVITGIASA